MTKFLRGDWIKFILCEKQCKTRKERGKEGTEGEVKRDGFLGRILLAGRKIRSRATENWFVRRQIAKIAV